MQGRDGRLVHLLTFSRRIVTALLAGKRGRPKEQALHWPLTDEQAGEIRPVARSADANPRRIDTPDRSQPVVGRYQVLQMILPGQLKTITCAITVPSQVKSKAN